MMRAKKARTTFEVGTDHTGAIIAKEVRDTIAYRAYKYLRLKFV